MTFRISVIGAGNGQEAAVSGEGSGGDGFVLGNGQVTGLYEAPVDTEFSRARRQRGTSFKGKENPGREMNLGFHVYGERDGQAWLESHSLLRSLFTYQLDPWWPEDELARISVESDDGLRELHVQMSEEPEFAPDIDPDLLQYGNVFYKLTAAQPLWESPTVVTSWETGSTSGSGTIAVSNPTDQVMYQRWTLTPGTWNVPDVSWSGKPRKREPGGTDYNRSILLNPVTSAMGGLTIDLDPMDFRMESESGENVMGQVGGGYYFLHEIPPHTPKTELPIYVSDAPAGGARAELHQPRLWGSFIGGY